jgi:hypothetical protein
MASVGRLMKWQGFGMKWLWNNRGSAPVFAFSLLLRNWKVHHRVLKRQILESILGQWNPVQAFTPCLFTAHFRTVSRLGLGQSRDSSVSIVTGYGLDGQHSIPGRGKRFFSSTQCPDRLWVQPNLLSNRYRLMFRRGKSGRGMKLTIHLNLTSRSRMAELYIHSPMRLLGVNLN